MFICIKKIICMYNKNIDIVMIYRIVEEIKRYGNIKVN